MKKPMIHFIKDGFKNIMKGLGSSRDPRENTYFQRGNEIDQTTANSLYAFNWLAAKVVDAPVNDATRKWRKLLISDPDMKNEVEQVMSEYDIKGKFNIAMKWARVFGGAVLVVIIDGEDMEAPLIVDNIREGSFSNLIPLDRYNLYPDVIDRNILSINFGKPEYYTVSRGGQRVHHSRIIKFEGLTPTIQEAERNNFWGNSVFQKLLGPITDQGVVSQSIASLIYESNVDVYKINGLYDMVASGDDNLVVSRLQVANEMKSILNAIVLDKEDDYDKKTNTFTTLPEIDDRFIQKVAGASDIPVTRLIGISPAGMNSTGDSDQRNYYSNVQDVQENVIRPRLDYIDAIILASCFPGEEQFEYEFIPLQQLTEAEQADVNLKDAQTDQILYGLDAVKTSDIASRLVEIGIYPTLDSDRVEELQAEEKDEDLDFEEETEENTEGSLSGQESKETGEEVPERDE